MRLGHHVGAGLLFSLFIFLAPLRAETLPSDVASYIETLRSEREKVVHERTDFLILPNGLKLFLISDPLAKKSAVSVRVGVGDYADPKLYRGLAHFMEHVLFLGSKKYPRTDEFSDFISAHQGESNAFTDHVFTNFFLTIPVEHYPEAVDRLAQFFIAPRFDARLIGQELQSIQSEYEMNISDNDWRLMFLAGLTVAPSHPRHWNFQGNMQTLGSIPRSVFLDFYKKYYSANLMTVVMISSLPLNVLRKIGASIFAKVENRRASPPRYPSLHDARIQTPRLFLGQVEQQERTLRFTYSLPPASPEAWKTKDLNLISDRLRDLGEGSIGQFLLQKGWLSDMDSYLERDPGIQNDLIWELKLTPAGYRNWRRIASGLLAFIETLKSEGPSAAFANAQKSAELSYLYQSEPAQDRAVSLSIDLQEFPPSEARERSFLKPVLDPSTYQATLAQLTPASLNVFLLAPEIVGKKAAEFYDFKFTEKPLLEEKWVQNVEALSGFTPTPPLANPYLPRDLSLIAEQDAAPAVIAQTALTRSELWRNTHYNRPQARVVVRYDFGPEVQENPDEFLRNELWVDFVEKKLADWAATPRQLDYTYEMTATPHGLNLEFAGYSDRIDFYIQEFFDRLRAVRVDEPSFQDVREEALREAKDRPLNGADEQALWIKNLAHRPSAYSDTDELTRLEKMTATDLENFRRRLLISGRLRILSFGNISTAKARAITDVMEKALATTPAPLSARESIVETPEGTNSYLVTRAGPNNAWVSEFLFGALTPEREARARLIATLLETPFYSHMRTEKQFGYIAQAWPARSERYSAVQFLVQSTTPSPRVAQEGRRWLAADFLTALKNLPQADFNSAKISLVRALREPPPTLDEKWNPIRVNFLREAGAEFDERTAEAVDKLTREELVEEFENFFLSPRRREWTIYLDSIQGEKKTPRPRGENSIPSLDEFRLRGGRI